MRRRVRGLDHRHQGGDELGVGNVLRTSQLTAGMRRAGRVPRQVRCRARRVDQDRLPLLDERHQFVPFGLGDDRLSAAVQHHDHRQCAVFRTRLDDHVLPGEAADDKIFGDHRRAGCGGAKSGERGRRDRVHGDIADRRRRTRRCCRPGGRVGLGNACRVLLSGHCCRIAGRTRMKNQAGHNCDSERDDGGCEDPRSRPAHVSTMPGGGYSRQRTAPNLGNRSSRSKVARGGHTGRRRRVCSMSESQLRRLVDSQSRILRRSGLSRRCAQRSNDHLRRAGRGHAMLGGGAGEPRGAITCECPHRHP